MKIREFQELIAKTFLVKDRKRGVDRTFVWFCEEIGELARAMRSGDASKTAEEMSDVLAWLASIATLLEVDLEDVSRRYIPGCPKCRSIPCSCPESKGFGTGPR